MISEHYANLLRKSLTNIRQVEILKDVVYVLDTDLIRNFVENRFASPWMAQEAERFLTHPNVSYAIPLGAFLEISHWLRSIFPERPEWLESTLQSMKSGEPRAIARAFAQTLGVPFSEIDNTSEIVDRTVRTVDRSNAAAERFLRIITRDNFCGIVSGKNLDDVQRIFRILSQAPRKPKAHNTDVTQDEDRVQKDYHDSINLAIVFQSVRDFHLAASYSSPSSPRYVLVTNTFVLRNLPRWVNAELPDSAGALSELIGLATPVVEGLYPVLSPQEAFVVEEARGSIWGSSRVVEAVTEQKKAFDALSDLLRNWESQSNSSLLQFEASLRQLSSVYYSPTPLFAELERERSINTLRRRIEAMQTSAKPRDLDKLEQLQFQARSFFKVLHNVHNELSFASKTEYSMALKTLEDDEDFDTPYVQRIRMVSSDSQELIIEGELYQDEGGAGPRAFVLRWYTAFSERQFFEALSAILRPIARPFAGVPGYLSVRRLIGIGDEWTEGFLIYSTAGVFGCMLNQLPPSWQWKDVTRELLRGAVTAAIECEQNLDSAEDDDGSAPSVSPAQISIKAARVATRFGDFQIELDPDPIGGLPVISILSSCRIPEHISLLCERTHPTGIISTKLNDCLRPLTDMFQEFSPERGRA